MSDSAGLTLTIILEILAFGLINYYALKHSQHHVKRRIWAGVIFLLFTPMIFFATLFFVLTFDESGWGAGILAVIFTGLYIVNGLILLLSALHLHFRN
jgi:heme/copper-type cytochrome/quinol oxidase subunit 3